MASSNVSVEVKPSKELKELFDRVPQGMSERLAEVERVLIEICDHNGIAFNIDQVDQPKRERVLRNVSAKD